MHWLDITLLVVLGLGALLGAMKGLVLQIARLIALGVAIYACIYYHEPIATAITPYFLEGTSSIVVGGVTYLIILVAIYVVFLYAAHYLDKLIKVAQLKSTDRMLGAGLGLIKAGLLAGTILSGLAIFANRALDSLLAESKIAPTLLRVMQTVVVAVPQSYRDELTAALNRINKEAEQKGLQFGNELARQAVQEQITPKPATTAKPTSNSNPRREPHQIDLP